MIRMNAKWLSFLIFLLPLPLIFWQITTQDNGFAFWNVVTVSFGAIAYSYLCFILFLGTRPRWIKYEVAQKFHRVLPILAIAAILLHSQTEDFVNNPDGLHGAGGYGELSQNVFLIMGGLSILFLATKWLRYTPSIVQTFMKMFSFIRYDWMKWVHHLQIFGIIFMAIHVILVNIAYNTPMTAVPYIVYFGVALVFYIPFLLKKFARRNATVASVTALSSVMYELKLHMNSKKHAQLGQAAWIRINGMEHPFTIADVNDDEVTIIFKKVGPFTKKMAQLQSGDRLYMTKGYGKLPKFEKPTIYIAGGSGIAVAMSYIKAWSKNPTQPFHLYWSVRKSDELVYDRYFRQLQQTIPNFYYTPYVTQEGLCERLTYKELEQNLYLEQAQCFICASAKASFAFERMLHKVQADDVHAENF